MARNFSAHPRVRLWRKSNSGHHYLYWRDPRDNRRQRNDSTGTEDSLEAQRMALSLSRYLRDPENSPPDLHPKISEILGINLLDQRIVSAKLAIVDDIVATSKSEHKGKVDLYRELVKELVAAFGGPAGDVLTNTIDVVRSKFAAGRQPTVDSREVYELLDLLKTVSIDRDQWRDRSRALEGLVREKGQRFILRTEPKSIKQAVEEFMAAPDGMSSKGQWRYSVECWLNRFARELKSVKNVHDLTPEQIVAHIQKQKGVASTKTSMTTYICLFMKWVSKGTFDCPTVRSAILDNLEEESPEWFWLKKQESLDLIARVRKLSGDYWADAALLQYGCGWRPEELPLLKRSAVAIAENACSIRIAPIFDDKRKLVRRIKTQRSEDTIIIPSFAREAVERRMAATSSEYLLFPLFDESLIQPKLRENRTRFESNNHFWPAADDRAFTDNYRPILRKAANELAKELTGAEKKSAAERFSDKNIDSRTLRRTCAREMILAHGFEKAAAVLRDSIETLRKHYADLQAADVSTER